MSMSAIRPKRRPIVFVSCAFVALSIGITGCGTSNGSPATSPSTPSATTTTNGTSQMLPPVMVSPDQSEATVPVGRYIVFNVDAPANTTVATDQPELLELSQGHDDGSAIFNPGGKAIAAGTAIVTITGPDGESTHEVTVHITP